MNIKQVAMVLAETLAETGEVIEGHAYAAMMGVGVDLMTFQTAVAALVQSGLATTEFHVLKPTKGLLELFAKAKVSA